MPPIERLLLFKIGAIGDVLLTTPLIRTLRDRFPAAMIDYYTGAWSAPALRRNPHVNHIFSFPDSIVQQRDVLQLLRLAATIRRKKYEVIFVLDPSWQVQLLASLFGGYHIPVQRNNQPLHDSQHYLNLGQAFGCATKNTALELIRTADDETVAETFLTNIPHPRVAVCPGGAKNPYQNMPSRRWSPGHYAQLISRVRALGLSPVILANKNFTLAQTAAVMSRCDVVVTHDQGLMHVAATTSTPILALFGPTDPRVKKPLGSQHRVIQKASHDLRSISVAEVMTSLTEIART